MKNKLQWQQVFQVVIAGNGVYVCVYECRWCCIYVCVQSVSVSMCVCVCVCVASVDSTQIQSAHAKQPTLLLEPDMVALMMTFHLRLKWICRRKHTRLEFYLKSGKIPMCWKSSTLWQAGSLHLPPSWITELYTYTWWSPPSTQQWLKQPVRSLAITITDDFSWYHINDIQTTN